LTPANESHVASHRLILHHTDPITKVIVTIWQLPRTKGSEHLQLGAMVERLLLSPSLEISPNQKTSKKKNCDQQGLE
jgi:hypothetical protein